jgi:hypothetical protein
VETAMGVCWCIEGGSTPVAYTGYTNPILSDEVSLVIEKLSLQICISFASSIFLTQLMTEKDFDKITINEIADRANVNRGTIYLHYMDKADLLNQCIDTHLNKLFETCMRKDDNATPSAKIAMLSIFEYMEQHAFFYSNMLTDKGIPTFRNRLLAMVQKITEEQIDKKGSLSK